MVNVFAEARRVLRDDGVLFLNLGDSYITHPHGPKGANAQDPKWAHARVRGRVGKGMGQANRTSIAGLKHKDLVGIPWRVAFALQAAGWYLRSDIIWNKPNCMSESVFDRPTKSHEYIFLLTKKPRYYYDGLAIREKSVSGHSSGSKGRKANHQNGRSGFSINPPWHSDTRNKRSVWSINTKPLKAAHFATFPPALVLPCILAGTSEKGCCPICGAQWKRIVKRERKPTRPGVDSKVYAEPPLHADSPHRRHNGDICGNRDPQRHITTFTTTGWKQGCDCEPQPPIPCTVADMFAGSGTVGVVAKQQGRSFIGCELNPAYRDMAEKRIQAVGESLF